VYTIKRVGGSAVTVSRSGAPDQVEQTGAAVGNTTSIATNYCSLIYQSDGVSVWYLLATKCY
jgi:hypothetical protein